MTESTITVGHDGLASDRIWRESGGQLQAFVRRRIADPHEADDVVGAIIERDEAGPSDALRELAVCMEPLLEGLPPEERRAVELSDLDGLTQARAAALEGVSVSGMKSRVQRGRRRLAQLLGECCALTLNGRGLPMDYTPPPDCACSR